MAAERAFNPLALDVAAFAQAAGELSGEWPAGELPRWAHDAPPEAPAATWPEVRWHLQGRTRPVTGGAAEIWLDLRVQAQARPTCQRCLQPVEVDVEIERPFRFVRDEAHAAELDADSEDDVLVLSRRFDVREWVEDELLLALPIVPMHEICPEALPFTPEPVVDEALEAAPEKPNPFAVLAGLKPRGGTET